MQPLLIKKKLISPPTKLVKVKFFKFASKPLKPILKVNGLIKVAKRGHYVSPQIVIKNSDKNSSKLVVNTKYKKCNCLPHLKQNSKAKLKSNCWFLTKKKNKLLNLIYLLCIGSIIGFINGFWGGGGGMVCVPTLTMLLGLKDKTAHATTILIMLPLSIASFVVYLLNGTILWQTAGVVTAGFVLGGVLGALLLKKINNTLLKIVFSLIIIAGAIKMLI